MDIKRKRIAMQIRYYTQRIGLILQLMAAVIPVFAAIITGDWSGFLAAYLLVGVIQVISCLCHLLMIRDAFRSRWRIKYELSLLLLIILGFVAYYLSNFKNTVAYIVMFASPVLAVFYFSICRDETRRLGAAIHEIHEEQ